MMSISMHYFQAPVQIQSIEPMAIEQTEEKLSGNRKLESKEIGAMQRRQKSKSTITGQRTQGIKRLISLSFIMMPRKYYIINLVIGVISYDSELLSVVNEDLLIPLCLKEKVPPERKKKIYCILYQVQKSIFIVLPQKIGKLFMLLKVITVTIYF